jgi:DNA polymerase-3 subunit beta
MFKIQRDQLLQPLQMVAGVVERRHTLPILSQVLVVIANNRLTVTATDLEVQLSASSAVEGIDKDVTLTLPGRKLLDICKTLPEQAVLEFHLEQHQTILKSGRSRFTLSTLPSQDFPSLEADSASVTCQIAKTSLQYLLEHAHFAMAQQDVRYFLNGLLLELSGDKITTVGADGHRMAIAWQPLQEKFEQTTRVIVPRKGIVELMRLLSATETDTLALTIGTHHIHFTTENFSLSSKLVDGRFPDYQRALPKNGDKQLVVNKDELKTILQRVSVLLDKNKAIRIELLANALKAIVSNTEQEEAEEEIAADYTAEPLTLGFNVGYLLDVLSVIKQPMLKATLLDATTGVLFEEEGNNQAIYVIMPMRI